MAGSVIVVDEKPSARIAAALPPAARISSAT